MRRGLKSPPSAGRFDEAETQGKPEKFDLPEGYTIEGQEGMRSLKGAKKHWYVLRGGKRDWGHITEKLAKGREDVPVGPVRVQVGTRGYGLRHAINSHRRQILDRFNSVEEYIAHVLDNGSEVIPLEKDSRGRQQEFLIAYGNERDKRNAVVIVWGKDGGYYTLKSAYTSKDSYIDKKSSPSESNSPTPARDPNSSNDAHSDNLTGDSGARKYAMGTTIPNQTVPQQGEDVKAGKAEAEEKLGALEQLGEEAVTEMDISPQALKERFAKAEANRGKKRFPNVYYDVEADGNTWKVKGRHRVSDNGHSRIYLSEPGLRGRTYGYFDVKTGNFELVPELGGSLANAVKQGFAGHISDITEMDTSVGAFLEKLRENFEDDFGFGISRKELS